MQCAVKNTLLNTYNYVHCDFKLTNNLLFSIQDGFSPLYAACQNGHRDVVDLLLEHNANINLASKVHVKRRVV